MSSFLFLPLPPPFSWVDEVQHDPQGFAQAWNELDASFQSKAMETMMLDVVLLMESYLQQAQRSLTPLSPAPSLMAGISWLAQQAQENMDRVTRAAFLEVSFSKRIAHYRESTALVRDDLPYSQARGEYEREQLFDDLWEQGYITRHLRIQRASSGAYSPLFPLHTLFVLLQPEAWEPVFDAVFLTPESANNLGQWGKAWLDLQEAITTIKRNAWKPQEELVHADRLLRKCQQHSLNNNLHQRFQTLAFQLVQPRSALPSLVAATERMRDLPRLVDFHPSRLRVNTQGVVQRTPHVFQTPPLFLQWELNQSSSRGSLTTPNTMSYEASSSLHFLVDWLLASPEQQKHAWQTWENELRQGASHHREALPEKLWSCALLFSVLGEQGFMEQAIRHGISWPSAWDESLSSHAYLGWSGWNPSRIVEALRGYSMTFWQEATNFVGLRLSPKDLPSWVEQHVVALEDQLRTSDIFSPRTESSPLPDDTALLLNATVRYEAQHHPDLLGKLATSNAMLPNLADRVFDVLTEDRIQDDPSFFALDSREFDRRRNVSWGLSSETMMTLMLGPGLSPEQTSAHDMLQHWCASLSEERKIELWARLVHSHQFRRDRDSLLQPTLAFMHEHLPVSMKTPLACMSMACHWAAMSKSVRESFPPTMRKQVKRHAHAIELWKRTASKVVYGASDALPGSLTPTPFVKLYDEAFVADPSQALLWAARFLSAVSQPTSHTRNVYEAANLLTERLIQLDPATTPKLPSTWYAQGRFVASDSFQKSAQKYHPDHARVWQHLFSMTQHHGDDLGGLFFHFPIDALSAPMTSFLKTDPFLIASETLNAGLDHLVIRMQQHPSFDYRTTKARRFLIWLHEHHPHPFQEWCHHLLDTHALSGESHQVSLAFLEHEIQKLGEALFSCYEQAKMQSSWGGGNVIPKTPKTRF